MPAKTIDNSPDAEETSSQHVDLFSDFEDKIKKVRSMDEEKRLEQEKYEKQIGYLMYLGQDTNEALGKRNWYDVAPKRCDDAEEKSVGVGLKSKHLHDPMFRFLKKSFTPKASSSAPATTVVADVVSSSKSSKVLDSMRSSEEKVRTKKSKKKKRKHHHKDKRKRTTSSSDDTNAEIKRHKLDNLEKLREKRLQREKAEQDRAKVFLMEKFPALAPPPEIRVQKKSMTPFERPMPIVKQKYNSQFNPELAKQNYN